MLDFLGRSWLRLDIPQIGKLNCRKVHVFCHKELGKNGLLDREIRNIWVQLDYVRLVTLLEKEPTTFFSYNSWTEIMENTQK